MSEEGFGKIPLNEIKPDPVMSEAGNFDIKRVKDVIGSHGTQIEGVSVSEGDVFFIPKDIEDSQLLDLVAKKFKVERAEEAIREINKCFQDARDYLTEYLNLNLPDTLNNIEEFKKGSDLAAFLKNTRASKKLSPYFCALSFLVLAEREFNSAEMDGFVRESDYLFKKIIEADSSGIQHFIKKLSPDAEYEEYSVLTEYDWINKVNITFRGKSRDSIITKFARHPEINADEVVRDGIGLKFEVESEEDAFKFVGFLGKYFEDKLGSDVEYLQNVEFLDKEKTKKLEDSFDQQGLNIPILSKKNTTSNKNFRTIKLIGKIKLPKNGKENNVRVNRFYEVQIVVANNKNERGMTNHSVYKAVQKLSVFTRLFGSFTEHYLCLISKEANRETGLNEDDIKEYIKANFLSVIIPSNKAKKSIKRYGSTDQLCRLEDAGLLPAGYKFEPINSNGNKNNKGKNKG